VKQRGGVLVCRIVSQLSSFSPEVCSHALPRQDNEDAGPGVERGGFEEKSPWSKTKKVVKAGDTVEI
jgi:hypothetical protein